MALFPRSELSVAETGLNVSEALRMDHLNLGIQRHSTTSISIEHFDKDRSVEVSDRFVTAKKVARGAPRDFLPHSTGEDQLAALRLTLPSASEVSFWSVILSSSSVLCRMLAQSLRPSCRAHAIRLP